MIGSSLIYYYETSPDIKDKGLNLRRVRIEGDKPDTADEHGSVRPCLLSSLQTLRC